MKRLAIIGIRGFPGVQGGVERHCEILVPMLARRFECRVYRRLSYLSKNESMSDMPNVSFVDLPSTRYKGIEAFCHTLFCCLHLMVHRVDMVNIHNLGPGIFAPLLRMCGMKVVLTYHSVNYEHDKWGRFSKMFLRFSEKVALRFSNRVIFVNRFQMNRFGSRVKAKSVYIPNGIEPRTSDSRGNVNILENRGIHSGQYVLGVGRITPEKGFDNFIKAANEVPEIEQVVIAGTCDHDTGYLDYLRTLDAGGKVVFAGYATGEYLQSLYRNARLFALTSLNEGFPMVMLEAMSFGLPMAVSDIPATRLVTLDEECYMPVNDVTAISAKLGELYNRGIQRVKYDLSGYAWEVIASKTVDVYDSLWHSA